MICLRGRERRGEPPEIRRAAQPAARAGPARPAMRNTDEEAITIGLPSGWFGDVYHLALRTSWPHFLLSAVALYIAINLVFGLLYLAQAEAIAEAQSGSFVDAFFFSAQTMATVGYGRMWPATPYANLVATVEGVAGLLFLAAATGLTFVRVSRPDRAHAVQPRRDVGPHNGTTDPVRPSCQPAPQPDLAGRGRGDPDARRDDRWRAGYPALLRSAPWRYRTAVFALSFTIMNEIHRDSPLFGTTPDLLMDDNAELIVTATGIDETSLQPVNARTSYRPRDILWNHCFVDVIGRSADEAI